MNYQVKVESIVNHLYQKVEHNQDQLFLVLIGGCSRSGKSVLAETISERLDEIGVNNSVVELDSWLIGADQRKLQSAVLERYDGKAIVTSINSLLHGETIFPPIYNVRTRTRFVERRKTGIRISSGVLIVEGVIALAIEPLVRAADLRLFVAISDVDRLRRLRYFYTNKKGLTLKETEEIIQSREMEEVPFIKKTENNSDVVVADPAVEIEIAI